MCTVLAREAGAGSLLLQNTQEGGKSSSSNQMLQTCSEDSHCTKLLDGQELELTAANGLAGLPLHLEEIMTR